MTEQPNSDNKDGVTSVHDVTVRVQIVTGMPPDQIERMFAAKTNRLISAAAFEVKGMLAQLKRAGDVGKITVVRKDGQSMEEAVDVVRSIISRNVGSSGLDWPKLANSNRRAYQTIVVENEDGEREIWVRRVEPFDTTAQTPSTV